MTETRPSKPRGRRPGWVWAWMPVAVFALQGVVLGVTILLATGRGLDAVEPDYYARSLTWDDRAALLRRADELGWSFRTSIGPQNGVRPDREVGVEIQGPDGQPVIGAKVSVELFHHAYAGDRQTVELAPTPEAGRYTGETPIGRAGLWELRVLTQRGADRCLTITDVEVGG